MSAAHGRLSGLTARTILITALVAFMAFTTVLLIGQTFSRLHAQVERLTATELERLMSSVRLIQQTESLVAMGLLLAHSETHDQRRAALVELDDRLRWMDKLTGELLSGDSDAELEPKVRQAQRALQENVGALDRLVRMRIDATADPDTLAAIRSTAQQNREIVGQLSVLIGYYAASIRHGLAAEGQRLHEEGQAQRRSLVVLAALLVVAVVISGLYFELHVVRRIQRMREALSRNEVRPNDLNVGGRDEIVDLARTIGGYIERIQAQESRMQKAHAELAFLAEHDPLTGLANRRHFATAARRLLATGSGLTCLAIIDVDLFKRVNDAHGHEVGDRALVHVATELSAGLRGNDVLARFGGEEFVALLPVRSLVDAQRICETLRARVAARPLVLDARHRVSLTVSIGLTAIPPVSVDPAEDQDALDQVIQGAMRRADVALYAAKADGRNLVRVAAASS